MTSFQITYILDSIQEVRLNDKGEVEAKFKGEVSPAYPDGWEPTANRFGKGTFTEQLFLLIQKSLKEDQ